MISPVSLSTIVETMEQSLQSGIFFKPRFKANDLRSLLWFYLRMHLSYHTFFAPIILHIFLTSRQQSQNLRKTVSLKIY